MKVLGISSDEQKALWLILGAIYHLGAAGATKGNAALWCIMKLLSSKPKSLIIVNPLSKAYL